MRRLLLLLLPHSLLNRLLLRPFVVLPHVPRFKLFARDFLPHRPAISDLLAYGQASRLRKPAGHVNHTPLMKITRHVVNRASAVGFHWGGATTSRCETT